MDLKNLLQKFDKDGFIILKKSMNKTECKKLINQTLIPILHSKNIFLTKPHTWNDTDNTRKEGQLIYGKNGGHIIKKNNKHFRFKSLFNSKKLNIFLNSIHKRSINSKNEVTNVTSGTSGTNGTSGTSVTNGTNVTKNNKWNFNYLAKEGLGWLHLRYPCFDYSNYTKRVKCPDDSFHLDGLNYNNTINPKQSIVLLPFIHNVKNRQGGTAVIPGSHKLINNHILRHYYKTNIDLNPVIDKIVEDNKNNIIDTTGEQGDILIMHPHLVHSPTLNDINSKIRMTFNLSTEIN